MPDDFPQKNNCILLAILRQKNKENGEKAAGQNIQHAFLEICGKDHPKYDLLSDLQEIFQIELN